MAKIKSLSLEATSVSGDVLKYTVPVSVGVDGAFRAGVPAGLEASMRGMKFEQAVVEINPKGGYLVTSSRLVDVEAALHTAMADHIKCEVKTERVIVFSFTEKVLFYHGLDGEIYPNATYDTAPEKGSTGSIGKRWHGSIGNSNMSLTDSYSIGLYAQVVDKVSYVRPSGTKIEYKSARDAVNGSYHDKLDSFLKLNTIEGRDLGSFKEVPFSEDAAKFFYEAMLGMCRVAHRLETFFSDVDKVQAAIVDKTTPLRLL